MKVASLAVWRKPRVCLNSAGFANHRTKELDGPYGPSRHQRVRCSFFTLCLCLTHRTIGYGFLHSPFIMDFFLVLFILHFFTRWTTSLCFCLWISVHYFSFVGNHLPQESSDFEIFEVFLLLWHSLPHLTDFMNWVYFNSI